METKKQNRWLVAIMGTLLMIVLGTVYAWSFFQKPIVETFGWSNSGVAWAFSMSILCLGLAAAWGGINLPKYGPTKLAVIGAIMYGAGFMLGALALKFHSLLFLIIGFGVIGGAGIGLGYVTPVVSASKWFPDRQGFVTGMVVMGFGLGALVMSKIIAPAVISIVGGNLISTFFIIGIIILVLGFSAAIFIKQPPADYVPEGYIPPVSKSTGKAVDLGITAKQGILTSKFFFRWMLLFINLTAGSMFISFQSPLMQDLWSKFKPGTDVAHLAAIGGTLIAISSLFNGLGRFFWGGLSDKIGRVQAFRLILGTQIAVFVILLFVHNPYIFAILVCYVLLCYGGGFGTMPSFVRDVFTPKLMPVVYGVILTGWSMGGVVGPQIVALMKDKFPENAATYSFTAGAILLAIGFIFALFLNNKTVVEDK
jgi:OFA family oxalate/formate antiporter-like MFS transporter